MIGHLYDENIVIKWSSYIGIGIGIGVFIADISVIGISVNLLIGAPLVLVCVHVCVHVCVYACCWTHNMHTTQVWESQCMQTIY